MTVTAAGVRVGYRQAKAGSAMPSADLARFARAGALTVVGVESFGVVGPSAQSASVVLGRIVKNH